MKCVPAVKTPTSSPSPWPSSPRLSKVFTSEDSRFRFFARSITFGAIPSKLILMQPAAALSAIYSKTVLTLASSGNGDQRWPAKLTAIRKCLTADS